MNRCTSRGYTLIELSVSLIVLGLAVMLVWRFSGTAVQHSDAIEASQALSAADNALIGFIAANSRLPCPDTVGDGREHCGGAAVGRLPFVTLGLARSDLHNVRYGVFRDAGGSVDLAEASDRFFPLLAAVPAAAGVGAVALQAPLGRTNGIDFCHALRLGGNLPSGPATTAPAAPGTKDTALNIRRPGATLANSVLIKNVAYAMSVPGKRSNPLTNLNTLNNSFAAPGQPVSADYDDTVIALDFGQLFARLSCAGVLTAAGHAHPNAASAAAMMYGAFLDYKVQLDLAKDMARTTVLSAAAGIASAAAGLATASANVLVASAWAVITLGSASGMVGFAAAAVITNAAAVATSVAVLVKAEEARDIAIARVEQFSGTSADSLFLLQDAQALATNLAPVAPAAPSIRINALAADAAGLY